MSSHSAIVSWTRGQGEAFTDNRYSRAHRWRFDGGAEVPASASPHIVPPPCSEPANVDPEEAFIAALSSCHMLFYLSLAAARGFVVDDYRDEAEGVMEKDGHGATWVARVVLKPRVAYAGAPPDRTVEADLHHAAHRRCFLANSVRTAIEVDLG
jgi:organic hydroperoxide reductase OsmC/OhrA